MLATRVIPTLLCRGRQLIKGTQFQSWRSCGLALQAARIHGMRGVDELVLLDIGATPEGRSPDFQLIEELSASMHTPLAVGGGVVDIDDIKRLLRAGADKVVIKTGGLELIEEASEKFGRQAIVAALDVDARASKPHMAARAADMMMESGAGEIMLTSIDREGMMNGYDLDMIRAASQAVDIPVISHGGCGSYQHMVEAITAGAHAVAAGALFLFGDYTPAGAAKFLRAAGIEVRVPNEEAA